jgi:AraC family carnitine catabolism transcriptional activator
MPLNQFDSAGGGSSHTGEPVWFLPGKGFSMLGLLAAVEPLRVANQIRPGLFRWEFISESGGPVEASNGMAIMTVPFPEPPFRRYGVKSVFVCAGFEPERVLSSTLCSWLSAAAATGATLGGIDTGSVVLARCGLLRGYRATVHWENLSAFREDFLGVRATENIYEIDRDRVTCSGATASLDMMLGLMGRTHGHELSRAISEQFVMDRIRDPMESQRTAPAHRLAAPTPALSRAVERMERAASMEVAPPLDMDGLAAECGLSVRQVQRLFSEKVGETPSRYYLDLRLERARRLLRQTDMRITDIAVACGFSGQAHFSRAYRSRFGTPPRNERAAS